MVGALDEQDEYSLCCLVELGVVDPPMASWIKTHDNGHDMIETINNHVLPIAPDAIRNQFVVSNTGTGIRTGILTGAIPELGEKYRLERKRNYGVKYRTGESLSALEGAKEVLTTMVRSAAHVMARSRAKSIHGERPQRNPIISVAFEPDLQIDSDDKLFDPGIIQRALDHNFIDHFLHGIGKQVDRLNEDVEEYVKAGQFEDPRPHYHKKIAEENARYNVLANAFAYTPISRQPTKPDRRVQKTTRKVIRKSYDLACRVLGRPSVDFYVGGKEIVVSGVLYDFAFSKANRARSLAQNGHGNINIFVRKRGDTKNLVSMCVYFEDTPMLDQLVGMTLLIRSGEEDTILKTANFSRHAAHDDPDLIELYQFADKEVYFGGGLTIENCRANIVSMGTNVPSVFAAMYDVDREREETIRRYSEITVPLVRAYVTDRLLQLISPTTSAFMESLGIPLPIPASDAAQLRISDDVEL